MDYLRYGIGLLAVLSFLFLGPITRWYRAKVYTRGRTQVKAKKKVDHASTADNLRWGNSYVPLGAATQHFLVVGTTGSGKSQIQKLLMQSPLRRIRRGSDSRAIIFDAKNDVTAFLRHIDVQCPVYSFNPFEAREAFPAAVRWDIAADITCPARAQNLASSLLPQERGGNNQYFTDAARQVVVGVIETLIVHSPGIWTFTDLVYACLSQKRIELLLSRDAAGRDILEGFFGDDRTAYQVFTTICSKMSYYRPVAALWQNVQKCLSVREWLAQESILLLGANATAKTALDAINKEIFRVLVEEIDMQSNSSNRRTWVWIDEARLGGPLISSPELLPFLAVKGRSRGVSLVLAMQDIEGLKEAAGERIANELVAQMSHKALLRMESDTSATWASKQLGQFETIEYFGTDGLSSWTRSISGQRVVKDSVLPSEFFQIPPTNPVTGLTGYFLAPNFGANRATIAGEHIRPVVVDQRTELRQQIEIRPEKEQWLSDWGAGDLSRLDLDRPKPEKLTRAQMRVSELESEA